MKVFLHSDNLPASIPWHNKFRELISQKYKIKIVEGNLFSGTSWLAKAKSDDFFIGRFRFEPRNMLDKVKSYYKEVDKIFNHKCFPSKQILDIYDDKSKQVKLFSNKYPFPKSIFYKREGDPILPLPCVVKKTYGAGSKNVFLARNRSDISAPCVLQEFCKNNEGDIRITTIGNRVMGYARRNRPNDFRASGSGLNSYPKDFPEDCVRIAHKVSQENNYECMAYDFIKDNNGKWVFVEVSYTFIDSYIKDCQFYYEMPAFVKKDKKGIYPEEFILEDLFKKNL